MSWIWTLIVATGLIAGVTVIARRVLLPMRNPHYNASRAHHRPHGFQNRYTDQTDRSLAEIWRWERQRRRDGVPRPPREATPRVTPDLAFLHGNAAAGADMQPTVTWLGHSTALVQMGGLNLLTDPVFGVRASPLSFAGPRRHQPPGIAPDALPPLDVVLISHNHYDHLERDAVRRLARQPGGAPLFVVPLGLKRWFARQGIERVVELDWWEQTAFKGLDIVLTPVQHWSARGLNDRRHTLWGGFAVFADDFQLYFAGDTGYSPDFVDTARAFADRQRDGGFDLALIPIGAYLPRWFMHAQHVEPGESVRIHRDVRARRSMGIHWGTFELTDESLDEPPQALAAACREQGVPDGEFFVLAVGETRRLPRRTQATAARRASG